MTKQQTTEEALAQAIRDHIAHESEGRDLAVHWTLIAGVINTSGNTNGYWVHAPDGQPGYITVGLMQQALHPLPGCTCEQS